MFSSVCVCVCVCVWKVGVGGKRVAGGAGLGMPGGVVQGSGCQGVWCREGGSRMGVLFSN